MSNIDHVEDGELLMVKRSWTFQSSSNDSDKVNSRPVLPVKGEKNVLVTSALPNVNDVPQLNDIFVSVLYADVFARYCRIRGWNTLYISGVNEHGPEIEKEALKENMTPQEMCDKYFQIHKEIYEWLNISFDTFGRTTSPEQTKFVQKIFKKVYNNDYTITEFMDCLLCENCNTFLADHLVEGACPFCAHEDAQGDQCDGCENIIHAIELIKPRCKICQQLLVVYSSPEFFLNLSKLKRKINDWIDNVSDAWSVNAQVINKSWTLTGLNKICITRNSNWGIPVPHKNFNSKVFYDWFAKPIGYMSITGAYTSHWNQWWKPQDGTKITYFQFMTKNDVLIHSNLFPACLFATENNYTFVNHITVTDCSNSDHCKSSKCRNIDLTDARNSNLHADIFRFHFIWVHQNSSKCSFNWADLSIANNLELSNNLGKFVDNTLYMLKKYFGSIVPEVHLEIEDLTLLALVTRDLKKYIDLMNKISFSDGLRLILSISRRGNQYIERQNTCLSTESSYNAIVRVGTNIGLCCNLACLLAIITKPFMPQIANDIGKQLNIDISKYVLFGFVPIYLQAGHKIGKQAPLFNTIDSSSVHQFKCYFSLNPKTLQKKENPIVQNSDEEMLVVVSEQELKHITSIEQLEVSISNQTELLGLLNKSTMPKKKLNLYTKGLLRMKKKVNQFKLTSDSTSNDDLNESISEQHSTKKKPKIKNKQVELHQLVPEFDFVNTLKNIKKE